VGLFVSAILLTLMLVPFVGSASAQSAPIIFVNFSTSLPIPIGQVTIVSVNVTDVSNNTVQLNFVGLRFEWSSPTSFFIGANSEKGAVLSPGQQIIYPIPVQVPSNVTEGIHKMTAYVSYRWLKGSIWSGTLACFWESSVSFALPQTTSQAPPPTSPTTTAQAQQPFDTTTLETVGVVIVVVAIGLFLERGRVKRYLAKRGGKKVEPSVPASGEPKVETEKEEPKAETPTAEEKPPGEGGKEEDL